MEGRKGTKGRGRVSGLARSPRPDSPCRCIFGFFVLSGNNSVKSLALHSSSLPVFPLHVPREDSGYRQKI